jgi:hypothetical protein
MVLQLSLHQLLFIHLADAQSDVPVPFALFSGVKKAGLINVYSEKS